MLLVISQDLKLDARQTLIFIVSYHFMLALLSRSSSLNWLNLAWLILKGNLYGDLKGGRGAFWENTKRYHTIASEQTNFFLWSERPQKCHIIMCV